MRVAKFHGQGRITIEEADDPRPAENEVVVRVAACALCGSDFRPWRQGWPVTSGHEIAGRIDQPGHSRHGERVVVYIPVFCGTCEACRAGRTHLCDHGTGVRQLIGWQRPGGYAEKLTAPERCLLPVPDDIPDRLAPLLLDTIGTTAHGVRLARRIVTSGKTLVLGAGPIGLGAIIVLNRMGFGPIEVVEPSDYRAHFAETLGVKRTTPEAATAGRYSMVIEATGKDPARQLALEAVAAEGAIVQLGESDAWSISETRSVRLKDFFLIRSFYFPIGDYEANLDLLRADRDKYERLVDAQADLDGLSELFNSFARGERLKPQLALS
ncbi:alcohol dehydrogenase catalytic domain-containing protein [Bradyrhizobium sp. WSM 1738]|uniref:alcohol dehydrogenase catalytic domain-containing protein n=1 Tax=Bradyrhizobium hereditatis TaxID=2821405 RepID=UPI001CE39723|nr:alcohol dehydrogenase catalytic domain-containing protein [Bradyrhizobium hereditatis]MCA6119719.1 alcohol dehydrogenase catalytic domain-containing protein [Bradyrhizobium hereditatis]